MEDAEAKEKESADREDRLSTQMTDGAGGRDEPVRTLERTEKPDSGMHCDSGCGDPDQDFIMHHDIVQLFLQMGKDLDYEFVYIAPQELMLQYFYVSFLFGICVTIPVLLYQAWAFIRPGLKKSENFLFLIAMVFGLLCFCTGAIFAYKIMLPFMLYFFNTLSIGSGVSAYISVQNYLSFLLMVLIIFGIVFELPMVSVVLNRLGLLKVSWMKAGRRVVIVVIFVIAALITPPDIVSQITVAIPVILLYEFSIFLCTVCEKIGRKKEDTKEEEKE